MKVETDILKEEHMNHNRMTEHRSFAVADISGRGEDVELEVNWNKYARKHGYIKLIVNGEEAIVSREHLYALLFMVGSAEEQAKIISPFMKQTVVTKFFKMIGITATKDIRKGEFLTVPLEFTLNPESNQVTIGKGSMSQINKRLNRS